MSSEFGAKYLQILRQHNKGDIFTLINNDIIQNVSNVLSLAEVLQNAHGLNDALPTSTWSEEDDLFNLINLVVTYCPKILDILSAARIRLEDDKDE